MASLLLDSKVENIRALPLVADMGLEDNLCRSCRSVEAPTRLGTDGD